MFLKQKKLNTAAADKIFKTDAIFLLTLSMQSDGDIRQLIQCVGCEATEISVKIKHFISWVRECFTRVRKGRISPSACVMRDQDVILQNIRFISIFYA